MKNIQKFEGFFNKIFKKENTKDPKKDLRDLVRGFTIKNYSLGEFNKLNFYNKMFDFLIDNGYKKVSLCHGTAYSYLDDDGQEMMDDEIESTDDATEVYKDHYWIIVFDVNMIIDNYHSDTLFFNYDEDEYKYSNSKMFDEKSVVKKS